MTWLITGASRGLGRHLALALARRGQGVIAAARDRERLLALAAEVPPGMIKPMVLDLSDGATLAATVARAVASLARLSGVINNAGIGVYKPFIEHSERESLDILQVNLAAVVQVCHAVLPKLLAQGSGHIVNIGSDLARRPLANMAVYAASKHGLAGFSQSLLREVKGAGIRVSLINPGIIDTDFGGASEGSRDESWSLRPAQLAELIVQLIEQPGTLLVDELTVHPLGQDF
ncbi:MAG: SDR family oxidoreductase [Rhodanobacteraceae bacterium]|nr:SDR family oxidoreductase [Rhodanobacteraceae bacterium]